jgi:hypothetical protein
MECERRACQELADILELTDACHRIPNAARLQICDRQRHQVTKQPGAKLDFDAVFHATITARAS